MSNVGAMFHQTELLPPRRSTHGGVTASASAECAGGSLADAGEKLLAATGICKSFWKAGIEVPVLRGVDLAVRPREFVAIVGQSGSGKSTLLHTLATLDTPDRGQVFFQGNRIDQLPPSGRDILRNRHFGMVFQFYHLLPELTTLENVLAPMMIDQGPLTYLRRLRRNRELATEYLSLVGLTHRLKHKPRELSGGEMQRTAIARALVSSPQIVFADEPTGNLDKETGDQILSILRRLNEQNGLTIVMVTHDNSVAALADRVVHLADGQTTLPLSPTVPFPLAQ